VQTYGQQAMQHLHAELTALEQGTEPQPEALDDATRQHPLLIGADGVMAPFRPQAGTSKGTTRWREVTVGIPARLGQRRTRRGEPVTRLERRRVVAVPGDTTALHARLWLEARRQAITSSPTVVWLSDGARGLWTICAARFAPAAIGVLDCSHVMQTIWQVLRACAVSRTRCWPNDGVAARCDMRTGYVTEDDPDRRTESLIGLVFNPPESRSPEAQRRQSLPVLRAAAWHRS